MYVSNECFKGLETRIVMFEFQSGTFWLSCYVMCFPCSWFRLQRPQFESDAILQYLMLYWVRGRPQGKHYDIMAYIHVYVCVYCKALCRCMYM